MDKLRTKRRDGSSSLWRRNLRLARLLWPGEFSLQSLPELKRLCRSSGLSIASGELLMLGGKWYVTHAGLLRVALRRRCHGIRSVLQQKLSDPISGRWVFKATVYKSLDSKGFVGYGDADPSNVSSLVRGAEMRVAETRAVNRALRKAYGIGLCSIEELGSLNRLIDSQAMPSQPNGFSRAAASKNGQPRLRDQLCLLIRQHNLDPTLVKAYAADFCGTQTLKEASRDLVDSFISHLARAANEDRDALICKLNSYAQPAEAKL